MALALQPRREPSRLMNWLAPVIAVVLTLVVGALLFTALGYDGLGAVNAIFLQPLLNPNRWQDLLVKAAPLATIAAGLAVGFRANVWNIGAEGQYVFGALCGTGVALLTLDSTGVWILPAMLLAGVLGGMAYASVPAFLRIRLGVNEILSSLMLNYVAIQLLFYLMRGPWQDPMGFGFPQTAMFTADQTLPRAVPAALAALGFPAAPLVHVGVPAALAVALAVWFMMTRTLAGFQVRVVGAAPNAARFAGFRDRNVVWLAFLLGGGLAGLAGTFEAAGPFGQMVPAFPVGYGFTAIIVAFLGRLHPLGILAAALVLALTYVGGESAQTNVGLPAAAVGVFQAMLLFFLLGSDILVRYRLASKGAPPRSTAGVGAGGPAASPATTLAPPSGLTPAGVAAVAATGVGATGVGIGTERASPVIGGGR